MSELYNSSITTRLIDPVFDKAAFRSEFRFQPNTAYLSNLRLVQFGISSNPDQPMNPALGSYGCIKSIHLFDGNQLLDQLLEASTFLSFKSIQNTNDNNLSLNRFLKNNALGYVASGNQTIDATSGLPERDGIKVRTQGDVKESDKKGWIELNQVLPFLQAALTLPTNIYKDLRLVINWKNPSELQDVVKTRRDAVLSTYEGSVLIADEMNPSDQRMAVMNNFNGLVYRPIEHDSYDLPAISGIATNSTSTQSNSNMVKGFNQKVLHKLLLVQTPTDNTTWVSGTANLGLSNQGSQALYKPKYQIRVNGVNKLTRDGWKGHNQRLAHLVDTFGENNIVISENQTFLAQGNNYIDTSTIKQGNLDYTALEIQERVDELIVDVERVGVDKNDALNQRIRINMFGEVQKELVMRSDGRYNVVYSSDM